MIKEGTRRRINDNTTTLRGEGSAIGSDGRGVAISTPERLAEARRQRGQQREGEQRVAREAAIPAQVETVIKLETTARVPFGESNETRGKRARGDCDQPDGSAGPSEPEKLAEARKNLAASKQSARAESMARAAMVEAEEAGWNKKPKVQQQLQQAKRSRGDASDDCQAVDGLRQLQMAGLIRTKCSRRTDSTEREMTRRATELTDRNDLDLSDGPAPRLALDSARTSTHPLDVWMRSRIQRQQIKDDFTDQEYEVLISIARDATRANWGGASKSDVRSASELFRQNLALRAGDEAATLAPRGTFDPLIPDVGALQAGGLLQESRHFARRRYKKSSDPNIQTARRHWFTFCLTHAHISPVRPQPGLNFDAAAVEEDIARCFVTYLARSVQGSTVASYCSNWKRWHRDVTGWDPVSSAIGDMPMLSQTLGGIRAELPSKERQRFAHPTRLFKEWWAPLGKSAGEGIPALLDIEPQDLSHLAAEQRQHFALVLRRLIDLSGISIEDLRNTIVSTAMTAALLRVSEAIPERNDEQPPPTFEDLRFVWHSDGTMAYAELMVLPLKKGRGVSKKPVKIPFSKGNVRAAFWLWVLTAIDPPVSEAQAKSRPLFHYFSWEAGAGKVISQKGFREWYQRKMQQSGIKHWRHYNTHSFRIGGATALLAANVSSAVIMAMGRWDSVVAEIYQRPTLEQTLRVGVSLDTIDARPYEDADDGFFDRQAGISEQQAEECAAALLADIEEDAEFELAAGDGDAE